MTSTVGPVGVLQPAEPPEPPAVLAVVADALPELLPALLHADTNTDRVVAAITAKSDKGRFLLIDSPGVGSSANCRKR